MLKVLGCISQQHDIRLVIMAGLICVLACFTTINMLWCSSTHRSFARAAWLAGAALVFGTGAWTTHFVGMLAYKSDFLIGYHAFETILSLLIVCVAAWPILWVFVNAHQSVWSRVLAGALLGTTVFAMHVVGTYAMRYNGTAQYDPAVMASALAVGAGLSSLALIVAGTLQTAFLRFAGATLLTAAIVGLHFTGMTAISIVPTPSDMSGEMVFGTPLLATLVIGTTGMIIVLSLFSSFVDQHLAWRTLREQGSLRHIAHHDILTGLPNRLAFGHALGCMLQDAERQGASCAVLCLDLDRFKIVNDLYGHKAGDEVLQRTAARLQSLTRPTDVVARISGDEFVIAMAPSTNPIAAGLLAARLVAALAEPMILEGQQICIGASVGIGIYPQDGTTAGDLLRRADMALYQAKRDGRGKYRFFESAMNERLMDRQKLEKEMRQGIEAGEFQLYYQPLFQINKQQIIGYEALIRWNHPTRGLIPPADFIPVAEESGLIIPLGRWVLETACREASQWEDGLQVSVNVSPAQFQQSDLADMVIEILRRSGFPPYRLELEMTESLLMHHADEALAMLRKLRDHGVRLALDDFGTGYSSLSYLRHYPFTKIKIDRSFVQSLGGDNDAEVLARAIVALGHSLGLEVTAEGVETYEQYEFLEHEACTQAQGFLFGKPVPANEIRSQDPGAVGPVTPEIIAAASPVAAHT